MRGVTHRGSSLPSCRTGPGPHGTWRAMPASVPQPTGAPDTACRQRRPASDPRRCVGCAPYSRVRRQPHGLKDCHTLCPDTGVGVPPRWAGDVRPPMASRVASNSLASCTFAPATTMLKGPPSPSTRRLRLVPALPRSVGLGPSAGPPKRAPCPWLRLPGAIPSPRHANSWRHPIVVHQGSPHSVQDARPHPPLKGAMNGAVVPKLFRHRFHWHPLRSRKMMPLTHLSWVRALAAPGFGRVFLQDDRFDPFPKLVRYFPDGL